MEISSNSLVATKKIGEVLAKEVLKTKKPKAISIVLNGELGSGKTSFVQGFARGLGVKSKILSPTFNIFKKFSIKNNKRFKNFYHFDCYRIKNHNEIVDLGFKEIIEDFGNIVIIEWGNKIYKLIPKGSIILSFKIIGENKRIIKVLDK